MVSWAPMRTALLYTMLSFSLAALPGCGDSTDPDSSFTPTISQGVWGKLVNGCDTSDCQSSPASGMNVQVLTTQPMMGSTPMSIASATSNDEGYYEITVDPGDYFLYLNANVGWTAVTIGQGLSECDWISGPGGGNWECSP